MLQSPVACVVQSAAFALSNLARDKETQRLVAYCLEIVIFWCLVYLTVRQQYINMDNL